MSERRLRLQNFLVPTVVVWDDGTELMPGPPVQPQPLTLAGLRDLAETWPEKLAELQEQSAQQAP